MTDTDALPFLKDGQLLLVNFGGPSPEQGQWVAFEVARTTRPFKFLLNFVSDITGFLPMAPAGVATVPGTTQASYISGQYVFPSSVTGVTDALEPQEQDEILHGFIGIAPQWLRVYIKQPVNVLEDAMDQNIVPSAGLTYVSYIDGFDSGSPLLSPSPAGEFVSLRKSSLNFDMANPSGAITSPEFQILLKRIQVQPATDYDRVHQAFQGRVPAKKWTIGDPLKSGSFSSTNYESLKTLTEAQFLAANYAASMKAAGYGGD